MKYKVSPYIYTTELGAAFALRIRERQARQMLARANRLARSARTPETIARWHEAYLAVGRISFNEKIVGRLEQPAHASLLAGYLDKGSLSQPLHLRHLFTVSAGWSFQIVCDQNHEATYKRGKWRTVRSADHRARDISYIVINSPKLAIARCGTYTREWEAPEGYAWAKDENGVKLYCIASPHDDYHPATDDVYIRTAAELVGFVVANRARRLELAAKAAAEAAEVEGVYVCAADSLRAGNCLGGTSAFAERHGLNLGRHYPAIEVLRMSNGDYGRVRLAISAAIMRHKRECAAGVAQLSEHQIN